MGGWGSGKRWNCKDTTDDYRQLDVRRMQRKGWLTPGNQSILTWSSRGVEIGSIQERAELDRIVVWYRHRSGDQPWESLEYPIRLEYTSCNYGGSRPWFICPALGCGRRVAILYLGRYLLCRHCCALAYESQRESPLFRALTRAQNLHIKMGGDGVVIDGPPFRRKGMHRRTFDRLMRRYEALSSNLLSLETRQFGMHLV